MTPKNKDARDAEELAEAARKLLGYKDSENFHDPYTAQAISERKKSDAFRHGYVTGYHAYHPATPAPTDSQTLRDAGREEDPNEEQICMTCAKPTGGRYLYCSRDCEKNCGSLHPQPPKPDPKCGLCYESKPCNFAACPDDKPETAAGDEGFEWTTGHAPFAVENITIDTRFQFEQKLKDAQSREDELWAMLERARSILLDAKHSLEGPDERDRAKGSIELIDAFLAEKVE